MPEVDVGSGSWKKAAKEYFHMFGVGAPVHSYLECSTLHTT